jgi:DNA-binding XRE family transcriptional regulator
MIDTNKFGKMVTRKRTALKISKTQLAGMVGVTEPTITRIEKGDDCYRLCTFIKCCHVLKINVKVDGIQQ